MTVNIDGCAPAPRYVAHFPVDLASAGHARTLVAGACRTWGLPHVVPDAEVVATELVENAVQHGRGGCDVTVELGIGTVTIGVRDDSPQPPRILHPAPDEPGGRGLILVQAMSREWGFHPVGGGKMVWATLDTAAPDRSAL